VCRDLPADLPEHVSQHLCADVREHLSAHLRAHVPEHLCEYLPDNVWADLQQLRGDLRGQLREHALLHLPVGVPAAMSRALVDAPASVAVEVGLRLARDDLLDAAIAAFTRETGFPESVHWNPVTVAQGDAGLAVLFGALAADRPGQGWERVGHEHLRRAVDAAGRVPVRGAPLYTGLAGIGFAALGLARHRDRYARLLAAVDEQVAADVGAICRRLAVLPAGSGCWVGEFDLIAGLAGAAAYLVSRHGPRAAQAADDAIGTLVRLVLDGPPSLPRWHTPRELLGDDDQRHQYPYGNMNCGLAHGLPGPLALLAIALRQGRALPNLADAVRVAARWLVEHRLDDGGGPVWPAAVPLPSRTGDPAPRRPCPARAGWCYGSPGVARALWLAGEALHAAEYREIAVDAMCAALDLPPERRGLDSPNLCHGVAGLLQITHRFAVDTGLPRFARAREELLAELLDAYEPGSILGFRNVEPGSVRVENPGLLDGATGVALVLLACCSDTEPSWDRLLLLS
jgi:hypothetical protein